MAATVRKIRGMCIRVQHEAILELLDLPKGWRVAGMDVEWDEEDETIEYVDFWALPDEKME